MASGGRDRGPCVVWPDFENRPRGRSSPFLATCPSCLRWATRPPSAARAPPVGFRWRLPQRTMAGVTSPEPAATDAPAVPLDDVLAAAVDLARAAAVEVGGDTVGMHLAALAEDDHVVSHAFAAGLPG